MDPSFDDLLGMACFAGVVETGSFTAAAARLGVSKSVVSARVARIEERLGTPLLQRTTRKLSVTDAGLELFSHCSRMLEAARAATRSAGDPGRGLIRINAPVSFAQMYLVDPLARFLDAHPGVSVEVVVSDRLVDLIDERVDLAIRISKLRDSTLVARRLASAHLVVCGSPEYLRRHGRPTTPEELLRHRCLRYTHLDVEDEWRFRGGAGRISVRVSGPFAASNGTVLREAAIAGIGLAVLPLFMVEDAIRDGRLETLLDERRRRPVGIYAVHPGGRTTPVRVRSLIDHLVAAFRGRDWG